MVKKLNIEAWVYWLLLLACSSFVYLSGLQHELIFDDERLTDGSIFGVYGNLLEFRVRMLSYGSFVWLDTLFPGSWAAQRIFNLILHLGVVIALYRLLVEMLRQVQLHPETEENRPTAGQLAAIRVAIALFALNPVAVYAVGYLIQRSIIMATFFVVLALLACTRGFITGKWIWFLLALVAYILAILSKEHAVMAVGLVLPLYVLLNKPEKNQIRILIVFLTIISAVAGTILWTKYGHLVGQLWDDTSRAYGKQLEAIQPGVIDNIHILSIINQAALFFKYGLLWVFPVISWMSIDLRPEFPLTFFHFPQTLGFFAFIVLFLGAFWALSRRSGPLAWVGFWLLVPLILFLTEFAVPWVQDPFVLYRSYLWAFALPALTVVILGDATRKVVYLIGLPILIAFCGLSFERHYSLGNAQRAWQDAADKVDLEAPPNAVGRWRPFLNLGNQYQDRGSTKTALSYYRKAEELGEPLGLAQFSAGMSLRLLGLHKEAILAFNAAENAGYKDVPLYFQRAESLHATGRLAEALSDYTRAIEIGSSDESFMSFMKLRRAEVLIPMRRYAEALDDLRPVVQAKPSDYRVLTALGMAQVGLQDGNAAYQIFDELIKNRKTAIAHYGRGMARFLLGDKNGALTDLDIAIKMEPGNQIIRSQRDRIAAQ